MYVFTRLRICLLISSFLFLFLPLSPSPFLSPSSLFVGCDGLSSLHVRRQGTVVMSRRKNLQTLRGMNNEPRRVQVRAAFSFALRLFLYTCYLSFSMKIISSVFLIYLIATQTNTHFLFASISNIYPPPPPPPHTHTHAHTCAQKRF